MIARIVTMTFPIFFLLFWKTPPGSSFSFIGTRQWPRKCHATSFSTRRKTTKDFQTRLYFESGQPRQSPMSSLSAKELQWNAMYQKLVNFKNTFGHCQVPAQWHEDPALGRWVAKQRHLQSKEMLQIYRVVKLEELEFAWSGQPNVPIKEYTHSTRWDVSFDKLVEFKNRFGHCRVPANWKEDPALGRWVAKQRHLQPRGKLSPDRDAKLNEQEFTWHVKGHNLPVGQSAKWDLTFEKLVEFKSRFRHCNVPVNWKENPNFGRWVSTQKRLHREGTLKPDREAKLNQLQFSWARQEYSHPTGQASLWNVSFDKLVEFKSRYGHCRVPVGWKEDPALGRWVAKQRLFRSKGILRSDREARLNSLQSPWLDSSITTFDGKWDALFQKLVEFKSRYGHCRVPLNGQEDMSLGRWIANQRVFKAQEKLRSDREAKLDELDSSWATSTRCRGSD